MTEEEKQLEAECQKAKLKKAAIGFATTLIIGLTSRVVTMVAESESVDLAIHYVFSNYPFLFTMFLTATGGGYFAQKWTRGNC